MTTKNQSTTQNYNQRCKQAAKSYEMFLLIAPERSEWEIAVTVSDQYNVTKQDMLNELTDNTTQTNKQSTKTTLITFDQMMTRINIKNQTDPKGQSSNEIYQTSDQNGYIYTVQVYFNDLLGSWVHAPYQDSIKHHVIWVDGKPVTLIEINNRF